MLELRNETSANHSARGLEGRLYLPFNDGFGEARSLCHGDRGFQSRMVDVRTTLRTLTRTLPVFRRFEVARDRRYRPIVAVFRDSHGGSPIALPTP